MNRSPSDHPGPPQDETGKSGSQQPSPNLDETVHLQGDTKPVSAAARQGNAESWIGRRLGKYEIKALLGVGGMGVVLKAHDESIGRDVAIKVLPEQISKSEQMLRRFIAEAKSAGSLSHPNIVTIYEVAHEGEIHYLVMEFVSGGSAAEKLEADGAVSVEQATRIVSQACSGLSAAHRQGLVHRDIKPANLLLTENGDVKIADFGLAKRTETNSMMLTQEGQLVGTPYFMSPEQCEGRDVDHRSDIYSLAATYYSLLTGKCPYEDSGSVVQVMFAHCNAGPPDPREIRRTVPNACAAIIQRGMAKNPADRYPSMDAMRGDLEAVLGALSGTGIQLPSQSGADLARLPPRPADSDRRKLMKTAVGAATVLLAGGGAWFLNRRLRNAGSGESGSGDPRSSAAAVPPAGDPLRVGILHSLTGTMGQSGASVTDATLLAIEEVNEEGGLLGRPLEPIVADGRSDPNRFAVEAERLIRDEKVCTVFGCWTSASRKTVVPVFEEHDHMLIYPVQYEGIEESPNVFYTGAAPNQQIIPAVKWAYAFEGKRRFYLVGSDYVFPRVAHQIIKDQLADLGAELAGEIFVPLGSSAVQPAVEGVVASKPDVILNCINGDTNLAFFRQLRAAGIKPDLTPTISFSVEEENLRQLDPSAMAGDYAAWNYFQSIDSPENRSFVDRFRDRYGPQRVVTDPMESAYFGVKLWAQAVLEAGSDQVQSIRRAMLHQRMRAPEGEVRIDPSTQHAFKTPRIGRVRADGQFDIVWTAASPERPEPYPASRTAEQWRAFLHDLYTGWGNQWAAPAEKA